MIGDARNDRYKAAIRTVLEDPGVDMGMVILTPQSMTDIEETASVVPEAIKGIGKPVVCSFMGVRDVAAGVKHSPPGRRAQLSVPRGRREEPWPRRTGWSACRKFRRRTMRELDDLDMARRTADHRRVPWAISTKRYLTQAECRPLLECYGLPLLKSGMAKTADEAAELADKFGGAVVMKVMSEDVVHKYDAGGVILNVRGRATKPGRPTPRSYANVEKAVPGAKIEGILIEQMAAKGVEVILGASRDPRFGPLMMFGLGGTLVEVLKDVSFRLAPMWQISAERMIREIRSFQVFDGFRGSPPADVDAIVDTLLRLSQMVCNHPEISELDINPLIVHPRGQGCSVADSRVMLRK